MGERFTELQFGSLCAELNKSRNWKLLMRMVAGCRQPKLHTLFGFYIRRKKKPNIFAWDEIPKGFKMNKL